MIIVEKYPIQWKRKPIDLAQLAILRWIEKWSVARLAKQFDRSPETIQMHICKLRKPGKLKGLGLSAKQLLQIKTNISVVFRGH